MAKGTLPPWGVAPDMNVFIHPKAIVESDQVGPGTRIWAFAHVLKGAIVGSNCNIGDGTFIEGGVRIGDNVTIKNQCLIWEGVAIADNAFIGPNVVFTNDPWPRSPRLELARERYATKAWLRPTVIGEGASLGAGVTVMCGIVIGDYAMVGLGGVVTRDLPAYALAYGAPARVMGAICRCGHKLLIVRNRASCPACGNCYEKRGRVIHCLGPKRSLVARRTKSRAQL